MKKIIRISLSLLTFAQVGALVLIAIIAINILGRIGGAVGGLSYSEIMWCLNAAIVITLLNLIVFGGIALIIKKNIFKLWSKCFTYLSDQLNLFE